MGHHSGSHVFQQILFEHHQNASHYSNSSEFDDSLQYAVDPFSDINDLSIPFPEDLAIGLDAYFVWDTIKIWTIAGIVVGAVIAVILNVLGIWMTVNSRAKCSGLDVLLVNVCLVNALSAVLVTPWFLSFAWVFRYWWPFSGYCIPWLVLKEFFGVVEGFTQSALALHQLVFFIIYLRSTDLAGQGAGWKQYGKFLPMSVPWIFAVVFLSLFTLGYDSSATNEKVCMNYDGRLRGSVSASLLVLLVHLGTFWIPLTVSIAAFLMLSFMLIFLRIKTASFNPFRKYDGVYTVTFITDADRTLLLDRNPQDNTGPLEIPVVPQAPDEAPLGHQNDILQNELSGQTLLTWMLLLGVDVVCVTGFEIFYATVVGYEQHEGMYSAMLTLLGLKLILDPLVVMGLVVITPQYRARFCSTFHRMTPGFRRTGQ